MSNRLLSFFALLFLLLPFSAFADIAITEVMYDLPGSDSGREWIEIRNDGKEPVDLTLLKLDESGTNHKIRAVGSPTVPAGGYAVIADNADKFRADYPQYSGLLFDSTFSLGNTREALALRDASLAVVTTELYDRALGGAGDGNSLNMLGGAFEARAPSPGGAMLSYALSPKKESEQGNLAAAAAVQKNDSAGYAGAVSNTDALPAAPASAIPPARPGGGMLPWFAALGAVLVLAGIAVFMLKKEAPQGSGYTITEEKP